MADGGFSHGLSRAIDWLVFRLESEPDPEDEASLQVILRDCEAQKPPRAEAGDDPDTSVEERER